MHVLGTTRSVTKTSVAQVSLTWPVQRTRSFLSQLHTGVRSRQSSATLRALPSSLPLTSKSTLWDLNALRDFYMSAQFLYPLADRKRT